MITLVMDVLVVGNLAHSNYHRDRRFIHKLSLQGITGKAEKIMIQGRAEIKVLLDFGHTSTQYSWLLCFPLSILTSYFHVLM